MNDIEKMWYQFYLENKTNENLIDGKNYYNQMKEFYHKDVENLNELVDNDIPNIKILFGTTDGIFICELGLGISCNPEKDLSKKKLKKIGFNKVHILKHEMIKHISFEEGFFYSFTERSVTSLRLKTYPKELTIWNNSIIHNKTFDYQLYDRLKSFVIQTIRDMDHIETKKKDKIRIEKLEKSRSILLKELDKDGNGIIDVIEGSDDFMNLFKKHQKKIIELDKQYIQKFIQISNYLKTKRQNIQDVFSSIKNTKNKLQLKNNVGILKNQIHSYELLLFHSLNMITSVVEDDLIVFYEIYESFDKLNIFNSNWENEMSQKLSNIGDGLSNLMNSINSMERNIVSGLNTLSYVTQDGFSDLNSSLSRELQSIDSSIQSNNLLTGIQTYQLYKINKQTKGLIE